MRFETVNSVTVNMKNMYHVFILCDRILKVPSENPYCPMYYVFYRKGALVARVPVRQVESFKYYNGVLDFEGVTVSEISDND